jgi:hypothetical protein
MNVRLLRRIQRQILKEPKQFWMDAYFSSLMRWEIPNCGTTACIAGWATALGKNKNPKQAWLTGVDARDYAEKKLKITSGEASNLFLTDAWPMKYRRSYARAIIGKNPTTAASIAVKRIDHFIKTKGKE